MPCHHKAKLVKKLINIQYSRLGALSVLLLCTIVLSAINSQNSVFARDSSSIESDLKIFGTDAIFPNSYPSTDHSNVDDRSPGSKDGSDAQGTTKAEYETATTPEVDETATTPEVDETATTPEVDETTTTPEEELNKVSDALSASGIFGLEF
jgi:cytoskeletal protein RodZ